MDIETGTPRRRFLKQASLVLAETQVGMLRPFSSAFAVPSVGQARSSSTSGSDLVVDTLSGKVRGTVQDGIRVFKGIPYGVGTAGKNRFMPPKKPVPLSGVRAATAFGHTAPQVPVAGPYDYIRLIDWLTFPGGQAEDCLALNVWTPAVKDNVKRPVLVSFHGGGFTTGTGSNIFYNGHSLAKFGDVVVVTLNHRLGCLGYLSMADIGAPPEFAQAGVAGMSRPHRHAKGHQPGSAEEWMRAADSRRPRCRSIRTSRTGPTAIIDRVTLLRVADSRPA